MVEGKTQPTLYTTEMRQNAVQNATMYPWAEELYQTVTSQANVYLGMEEKLWNTVTTQQLPRSITVGCRWDPEAFICPYCKEDLRARYGQYPWIYDWNLTPWKLQCPSCRNRFPTNDFGQFYQTGIDAGGNWNYELAKQNGAQYLINTTFTEEQIRTVIGEVRWNSENWAGKVNVTEDRFKVYANLPEEQIPYKWQTWGVDDGYGYRTDTFYNVPTGYIGLTGLNGATTLERRHTYIAYYNAWAIWGDDSSSLTRKALGSLRDAYLMTGDPKYGRVGAILIDRYADVFPDLDTAPYFPRFSFSDSTKPKGYAVGCIWDTWLGDALPKAYDAFYPMCEDPSVIQFLSEKAIQYNMENQKNTPQLIRRNSEDGICREVYNGVKKAKIFGNFGMHQQALATAAVVLDSDIDTPEMIDFMFRSGTGTWGSDSITGCNILETIANQIDRDGGTHEVSPGYSILWTNSITGVVDSLLNYEGGPGTDVYQNPKFIQAFKANFAMMLVREYTAQIGDSSYMGDRNVDIPLDPLIKAYLKTGDIEMGQMIWFVSQGDTDLLRKGLFDHDPEGLYNEIRQLVMEHGEYDFDRCEMLPAYGFSILRSGEWREPERQTIMETQRDFWMSFTKSGQHGHPDLLNLGMDQWGLNVLPEFAYPIAADGSDDNRNWGFATVNHNTVMVNDKKQNAVTTSGTPLHFDDGGRVKLMDADASHAYDETNTYRRTVVMIDVDDQNSYAVDFFNVKGGDEHLYLMHAYSNEVTYEGFTPTPQSGGTYAGTSIPYKTPDIENGYSYIYNVKKAVNPGTGNFSVDYKIGNFRYYPVPLGEKHFRIQMLNDFNVSEITLADMQPPQRAGVPNKVDQLMVRNSGTNLSTLFTAVLEPYMTSRFITQSQSVSVRRADGQPVTVGGDVKAVKVTIQNRVDYVVYATNHQIEYVVDNLFNFKGFVGVYTLVDGVYDYSYLNDGTKIGAIQTTVPAYTGRVTDFTRKFDLNNFIEVEFDQANVDTGALIGKYIYIDNGSAQNGVYQINGVSQTVGGRMRIDLGYQTTVQSASNLSSTGANYVFNIAPNQLFRIPLSVADSVGN